MHEEEQPSRCGAEIHSLSNRQEIRKLAADLPGGPLVSDGPDPHETLRLVAAFLNIRDRATRLSLVEHAEAIASALGCPVTRFDP